MHSNNNRNPDPNIIKCSERIADFDMKSSHIAIDIQDNILYAMGGGKADVTTGSYLSGGQHFFSGLEIYLKQLSGIKLGNWVDDNTRACTRSSFNFARKVGLMGV